MGNSSFAEVSLGDIVDFRNGKAIPPEKYTPDGEHPVYGSNGQIVCSDEVLCLNSTIVIGRVGAYCGCVHLVPRASWVRDNEVLKYALNRAASPAVIADFQRQIIPKELLRKKTQ